MTLSRTPDGDSDTAFCSRCGNENHDVYDGILDCGHSLDDGAWLVDADELRLIEEERAALTLPRTPDDGDSSRPLNTPEEARAFLETDEARERFDAVKAMMPRQFFVTATVTTTIDAVDEAAAMQELCNRLHPGVLAADYGIATVEARHA